MDTLETAKQALREGNYTCAVACRGKVVFTSRERGVKPLVEYIHRYGDTCRGAALADKVIGRAAALLVRLMGVTELSSGVVSRGALEELEKAGITVQYETLVEAVRNRDGTGFCPMERLSQGVEDPREMLRRAEGFLQGLSQGRG